MSNYKIALFAILIVLTTIVYFKYNKESLVSETNDSINPEVELTTIQKPIDGLTTDRLMSNNKDLYTKYTQEQKSNIKIRCEEYFYSIEKGINLEDTYIEKYKNNNNNISPTKNQIYALRMFNEKCESFFDYKDKLEQDFILHAENDLSLLNKQFYLDMTKDQGIETALETARNNLFNIESSNRHAAKMYLHKNGWLKGLNQDLDIQGVEYNELFGIFDTALEIKQCELGMRDCSSNSFDMLVSCQYLPETCGMDIPSAMMFSLTGYEITILEKYLQYLSMLN